MSEVAIRRQFIESAQKLIHERNSPWNIVKVVADLEAAINTMVDEPMRVILLSKSEALEISKAIGVDI